MKRFVDVTWLSNMAFEVNSDNHKFIIDVDENNGGNNQGCRPKPLMLAALGGCTGMDVVSILKKMKVNFDYFNVKVEGNLTEDHPKHFTDMKIIYEFRGDNLDINKIEKSIQLSLDKYCGVNAVYKKALNVTYEIVILD